MELGRRVNPAFRGVAQLAAGHSSQSSVETADIFRRAIALFPEGNVPAGHAARQIALRNLGGDVAWRVLSRLVDEFFALRGCGRISRNLYGRASQRVPGLLCRPEFT